MLQILLSRGRGGKDGSASRCNEVQPGKEFWLAFCILEVILRWLRILHFEILRLVEQSCRLILFFRRSWRSDLDDGPVYSARSFNVLIICLLVAFPLKKKCLIPHPCFQPHGTSLIHSIPLIKLARSMVFLHHACVFSLSDCTVWAFRFLGQKNRFVFWARRVSPINEIFLYDQGNCWSWSWRNRETFSGACWSRKL